MLLHYRSCRQYYWTFATKYVRYRDAVVTTLCASFGRICLNKNIIRKLNSDFNTAIQKSSRNAVPLWNFLRSIIASHRSTEIAICSSSNAVYVNQA